MSGWSSSSAVDISIVYPALGYPPDHPSVIDLLSQLGVGDAQARAQVKVFPDGSFHNYHKYGFTLYFTGGSGAIDKEEGEFEGEGEGGGAGGGLKLDRVDFYNPTDSDQGGGGRRRRPVVSYSSSPDLLFRFPSTTLSIPFPPAPAAAPAPAPAPSPAPASHSSLPSPLAKFQSETNPEPEPKPKPKSIQRPASLLINRNTTAQTLVEHLGEPCKKGGEAGWIETYLQWDVGILDPLGSGSEVRVGVLVELKEVGGEGMGVWDRAKGWEWGCLKVFSAQSQSQS